MAIERQNDRRKKVGDLRSEASLADEVLLEICRDNVTEITITVNTPGSQNSVHFKVDIDDNFRDVQEAAREALHLPDGTLHIRGLVHNNHDLDIPVTSWQHLMFLAKPAGNLFFTGRGKEANFSIKFSALGQNLQLILVSHTVYDALYKIWISTDAKDSGSRQYPIGVTLVQLSDNATIADLRDILESTFALSSNEERIRLHMQFPDNQQVFNQDTIPTQYSMPIITLGLSSFAQGGCGMGGEAQGVFGPGGLLYRKTPEALGIGMGGSIIQDVIKDDSDPRMWDLESSKILYVHLLASRDLKTIPGLNTSDQVLDSTGIFDNLVGVDEECKTEDNGDTGDYPSPTVSLTLLEPDHTLPPFPRPVDEYDWDFICDW
ncbi:polyubiquitin [Fusarium sp. NRRL 52700]|nr:polyubiquitin [Fusarium sp. NRRL 52700]